MSARILVVLPTLGDRLETLKETLLSIETQRADVDLTLVVVTPPGATAARELARKFDATVVDDPKIGISAAINAGIAAKTNETLYAWIGDDDLFRPGGLRVLLNTLSSSSEAVLAYGACEYISPDGQILATSRAGRWAMFLLSWGPDLIPHPGALVRLADMEAVGNFDVRLKYAMDLDLFLKLRRKGRFVSTKQVVSAFRWHPDSLTVSNRLASSLESEAVKRSHLPKLVRPLSYLWSYPWRWAASIAANGVSARAN